VYDPVDVIEPPSDPSRIDQATPVKAEFVITLAVNCVTPPGARVTLAGDSETIA
jgi:hypothetical protein